jgi:hypothetical protein
MTSPAAFPLLSAPRLPTFGWATFSGEKDTGVPCILDSPYRVFTSAGRAAIALALRDLKIGRGDRVLVPTYHCPTMIAPVVATGAYPLFFPIDSAGTPRIDLIANLDLTRVRAMIAAHYFGIPQPMAKMRAFCDQRGFALIEDCAHAMFGQADGRPIGSWGDYAIASLTKFLPTADGGCLVFARRPDREPEVPRRSATDELRSVVNTLESGTRYNALPGINKPLAAAFALVNRYRGKEKPEGPAARGAGEPAQRAVDSVTEFTAGSPLWRRASTWSRWIARFAHRQRIVATRRRNYNHLAALLADFPGARVLRPDLPEGAVPYVFPLWVAAPARSYQRVRRSGIPVFRWDQTWPDVPMIPGDCGPDWAVHIFQLGCHQDLQLDDLSRMADTLRNILSAAGR